MQAGKCIGTVMHHMLAQSEGTGTWYLSVMFKLEGDQKIPGKIWINPESEGCMRVARKSVKAMGFDIDTRSIKELDDNRTMLAGNQVELDIEVEQYQGNEYLKVKWINKIPDPKEKGLIDSFDKGMRAAKKKKDPKPPMEATPDKPELEEPPF